MDVTRARAWDLYPTSVTKLDTWIFQYFKMFEEQKTNIFNNNENFLDSYMDE